MRSGLVRYPAPKKGWISNSTLVKAPQDAAEVLDNCFPTAQGARLRKGSELHATVGDQVERLFAYNSTATTLFAATDTKVYDITAPADAEAEGTPDLTGMGSGDWSVQQIATSGGEFILAANGVDYLHRFDGTDWNPTTTAQVNDLDYDALTADFTVGQLLTGGTSGATATIISISPTSATAGTLRLGTISGGPFQDDEAITDGTGGAATANGASASGSAITITGIDTRTVNQLWLFKNRIWMVEEESLSAWYLPADVVGGAATEFPLKSVFNRGGTLLFGAQWSVDAGDGLDDIIVFVTDQGEMAVYQGTDPGSDFVLSGIYYVGRPLNKHAHFKVGGDLLLVTEDGIVPCSTVISLGREAFLQQSLTYPIEDAWQDVIATRTTSYPITATLWPSRAMLLVGTPKKEGGLNVAFAANARTGAWCRFTGWDVRCSVVADDQLYFGTAGGTVFKAETGGTDGDAQYTAIWLPKFQENDVAQKSLRIARFRGRATASYTIQMAGFADYAYDTINATVGSTTESGPLWGTAVWGTDVWGGDGIRQAISEWVVAPAFGVAVAPALAIGVNRDGDPDLEFIALDAVIETGKVL